MPNIVCNCALEKQKKATTVETSLPKMNQYVPKHKNTAPAQHRAVLPVLRGYLGRSLRFTKIRSEVLMYPKVSTQPVVKLCSVVTAGRLSRGRCYSHAAFFAHSTYGRGTLDATVRAFAVLLYFLATIFSHRQLFHKPGRVYFRLVNCLYCLGCYTAQLTDYSLHPVSGTVSLRLPPVHLHPRFQLSAFNFQLYLRL